MRRALWVLVAVWAVAHLPLRAEASSPCQFKRPTASDGIELHETVRKAAGTQVSRLVIRDFCGHADVGTADLQSPFAYRTQGVREWLTIHCWREDAVSWQCEPLVMHRGIKLRATIGGKTRVVDTEFPPSMPLAAVRDLVARAANVMEAAVEPARCANPDHISSFADRPWNQQHGDVLYQAGQSPFVVTAYIEEGSEAGTTRVWLAGSLAIELPTGCWVEAPVIVVT